MQNRKRSRDHVVRICQTPKLAKILRAECRDHPANVFAVFWRGGDIIVREPQQQF
jgi:hypothetical protein